MKAKRARTPAGADQDTRNIERLQLELAAFNQRIAELERLHPEGPKIEVLKASAMLISRQIDELRCLNATEELTGLLAR
jgi:capsule polysaccharide export protein KpsE/RkpR